MKLLHYTSKDGSLRKEYIVLLYNEQCMPEAKRTYCEPDCSLSSESDVIPGKTAALPTEQRLVINGAYL